MKKNCWQPLGSHPEIRIGQYVVPNFVSTSVSIQVSDREFILYSPGEGLLVDWPDQWRGGDVKIHIIMPNEWHFMGVSAWQEAFSQVTLYASEKALPKLVAKGVGDTQTILALEDHLPPLPDMYNVLFPPGHRGGDVWLRKKQDGGSSTWITCDSFLNYERLSNQPVAKLLQKLLGAAPGLKMSQVVKWFILDDRDVFRQWVLNQLTIDKPTVLVPSHGEVASDAELYRKIASLVATRL